ncbi:hypothetical protein [Tenacibaculum ovolyticum]|uniref:hypothetical protein n=1 Tax=Tenacibaculum ovolyticum TaxID=104270 RepID=UPI0007EC5056|nr:hypothetical protein [Tenacibaculum ovolyticum]
MKGIYVFFNVLRAGNKDFSVKVIADIYGFKDNLVNHNNPFTSFSPATILLFILDSKTTQCYSN